MRRRAATASRIAAVASLLSVAAPAWAAQPAPGDAIALGTNIRFTRIGLEDGLAQSSVYSIVQDRQGYLWMATEDGLHRYDGYGFRIYRNDPADPGSISESSIVTLFEDRDGSLWIGTVNGGLNRYDPTEGRFEAFRHGEAADTIGHDTVYTVMQDRAGAIWAGTSEGASRFDPATRKFTRFGVAELGANGPRHSLVWSMLEDASGKVLVGTDLGLNRLDPATGKIEVVKVVGTKVDLDGAVVAALRADAAGRTWVATNRGLLVLDQSGKLLREYLGMDKGGVLPSGRVRDVLFSRSGEVWAGLSTGLAQIDFESGQVTVFRHDPADGTSLSDDSVISLMEDRGGVLWVGTDARGANRFNPATRAFQHYRHQEGNPRTLLGPLVWSVAQTRDGALWVGQQNGLTRIDRATGEYRHFKADPKAAGALGHDFISALRETPDGTLWVGTLVGLHRLRGANAFEKVHFKGVDPEDEEYLNSISTMLDDGSDGLWVGTSHGLVRYSPRDGSQRRYRSDPKDPTTLPADYITALYRSRDGTLWVCTDRGAAFMAPGAETFTRIAAGGDPRTSLSNLFVQTAVETDDGAIWFGTSDGLDRYDRASGTFEHLREADGLPNDTVYSLQRTDDGALWFSTNRGLVRLDPKTRALRTWLVEDGLQSNEFNGGAAARSAEGELFFGGVNGLNAFFPQNLTPRQGVPTVAITGVEVVDRRLELTGELGRTRRLTLPYTDRALTLHFAVFDYAGPKNNSFRYKLRGFDPDWREARTRSSVSYTNLDPGSYTFEVMGANTHGVWSAEPDTLVIEVEAPPWATWWAYLGYALLIAAVLFGVARAHHFKVKRDHELAAEQAKRRWSETLHQLSQSLASSLDAHQIAELLMDSLRRMVNFRAAALFVEKGVEIQLVGTRGLAEEQVRLLRTLPEVRARLFAECRHRREPTMLSPDDVKDTPLASDGSSPLHVLAIPTFSRAEEFSLLLVGRAETPFTSHEQEIAAAVARQALVALDNARLFSELQNLATTDNLTKVNNRRYFFELAELEFARSRRYGRNLAVILLDADGFTQINENFGHEVGDRVLRLIASTCRANLRHFDIIGRYGGEDFVVMLPETALNVAADVADRLRKAVDNMVIDTHSGELKVSVSLGVAVSTPEVPDLATLINRADMALYEAKRSGRNRVVVSEQG